MTSTAIALLLALGASVVLALPNNSSNSSTINSNVYDLSCIENSIPSFFEPSLKIDERSSGSWLGAFKPANGTTTADFACSPLGFGVTPASLPQADHRPMLESESNMRAFRQHRHKTNTDITDSAISFELWFTPEIRPPQLEDPAIFTIGQNYQYEGTYNDETRFRHIECVGFDFRVTQLSSSKLWVSFSDYDPNGNPGIDKRCRNANVYLDEEYETNPKLTQLVVVIAHQRMMIYLNGAPAPNWPDDGTEIALSGALDKWDMDYTMQLFSNYLGAPTFQGSIHRINIHDIYMTNDQVAESYLKGLEEIPEMNKIKESRRNYQIPEISLTPSDSVIIPEGAPEASAIGLLATSTIDIASLSSYDMVLQMEILSLPVSGTLSAFDDEGDDTTIQVGDRVQVIHVPINDQDKEDSRHEDVAQPLQIQALVNYTAPSLKYFNTPKSTATGEDLGVPSESLDYRLLVVSTITNDTLFQTERVNQPIHVVHVNHPPKLVTTMTGPLIMTDTWDEGQFNGRLPSVRIKETIALEDPLDLDMDLVRVTISAKRGILTLDETYRHLAIFSDACLTRGRFMIDWQCTGTGIRDRKMTFLALPYDVEFILSNLLYEANRFGKKDTISIEIFDGVGGDCLSVEEHVSHAGATPGPFPTIYNGQCYEAAVRIQVEALEGDAFKDDGVFNLPDIVRWIGIFAILCIMAVTGWGCGKCYEMCYVCVSAKLDEEVTPDNKEKKDGNDNSSGSGSSSSEGETSIATITVTATAPPEGFEDVDLCDNV